jgi:hypothetical protein
MKIFRTLLLLLLSQTAFAQLKVTSLDKKSIPSSIKYSGHIVHAARYTDNEGDHIVITTETGIVDIKSKDPNEDGFRKGDLYAYSYNIKNNIPTLSWQIHDLSGDCPVDPKASYVPKAFAVTDLNNDGKAEVWLMYSVACRGDVSPASMKIIMHEGAKKFAVRGESLVKLSPKETYGGKYTMDEAFKTGPRAFLTYAALLWQMNNKETW